MDRQSVASFLDELEKIGATVLMKSLSPAAKRLMRKATGFTGLAEKAQPAAAAQMRRALAGQGLHTEASIRAGGAGRIAKRQSRRAYDEVLKRQGRVYQGTPGLQQQLAAIPGHPGTITRTPARIVPRSGVSTVKPSDATRSVAVPRPQLADPYAATVLA